MKIDYKQMTRINDCCETMVNSLIFQTLVFLLVSKMLVIRAGSHKMLLMIANRDDPDQIASLLAV